MAVAEAGVTEVAATAAKSDEDQSKGANEVFTEDSSTRTVSRNRDTLELFRRLRLGHCRHTNQTALDVTEDDWMSFRHPSIRLNWSK